MWRFKTGICFINCDWGLHNTTQPKSHCFPCMCLLDVREDGGADGGMEEQRKRGAGGGINRSLGDVWKNINMPVFIFVCMRGEVCSVSAVYLGVLFFYYSCAFL